MKFWKHKYLVFEYRKNSTFHTDTNELIQNIADYLNISIIYCIDTLLNISLNTFIL